MDATTVVRAFVSVMSDREAEYVKWLDELGHYLLEIHQFDIIKIFKDNPEIARKSASLLLEEFIKRRNPRDFADEIMKGINK